MSKKTLNHVKSMKIHPTYRAVEVKEHKKSNNNSSVYIMPSKTSSQKQSISAANSPNHSLGMTMFKSPKKNMSNLNMSMQAQTNILGEASPADTLRSSFYKNGFKYK